MTAVYTPRQALLDLVAAESTPPLVQTGTDGSLLAGPLGPTVLPAAVDANPSAAKYKEHRPMRTRRIVRSLMVAGTAAALSILSLVSTVMAASGGGDFPFLRR